MLFLIGAGMFFDGFDIYLAAGVLGRLVREGLSDVNTNAWFISAYLRRHDDRRLARGHLG